MTVWCALWDGGIIGQYFFKNDEGHKVTVNGDRYRAMITNFFIPELNNHDVQELRFQQDGATCHTARATIDLLKDTFGDRLISRFGPVNWPPKSCDLTQPDYFLWGYVLDESRSFFRVHTGYFSNIPKCIKAEFIASWGCSQSSVVSSSKR
ncbi:transposase [Trichonephila clavipes]|nr:transposase [Trichonephila clavipes]